MRRLLTTSFIVLAFFALAVGVAPTAHAQPAPSTATTPAAGATPGAPSPSPDSATKAPVVPAPDPGKEFGGVMTWIASLFAWLVGVAALTLDWAVFYTVVTMGNYVSHLTAVGLTWRILRDLGNIILIFGFLAAGIATILNVNLYGWGKKMIPMLLASAVFLNFSLFIAEAVIDTGNLFATQFYTQIVGGELPDLSKLNPSNEGISNKIMSQLGFPTSYGQFKTNTKIVEGSNPWLIGFMGIILYLITAFVMFSLAFILIARFVILLFLIITAPLGFAGLAVPKLESVAGRWWSELFKQTIIAPVLLLLLYIALAVITDAQFLTGSSKDWLGFANGTGNYSGFANILLSFLIAMGLLLAVVMVAKNMGATGATWAMKIGKSAASGATKFAGRSTWGVTRWTAKKTAGKGMYLAQHSVLASKDFGSTKTGRVFASVLGKGAHGYHEMKEKSAKGHEEYLKERKAAIDDHDNPKIANAQLAREAADKAVGFTEKQEALKAAERDQKDAEFAAQQAAKTQVDTLKAAQKRQSNAAAEVEPLLAEVKRLAAAVKNTNDPRQLNPLTQQLTAARNAAAPVEQRLKQEEGAVATAQKAADDAMANNPELNAANQRVEQARAASAQAGMDSTLRAAQRAEEDATKHLTEVKKKAALAYAENIRDQNPLTNPIGWAAAGPGGTVGGNKIIGETLKKMGDTDKAIDMLRKAFEKDAEATKKSTAATTAASAKQNQATQNLTAATNHATQAQTQTHTATPTTGGSNAGTHAAPGGHGTHTP